MDSKFPNQLDDNTTLPAVNNNITEVGGDAINGLRSAVFNIEEALGLLPNGTEQDVSTRLSTSLNSDGSLKTSAISSVGLVSLPIVNDQISSSAEIEESKLNLDYNTTELKTWIDELSALISSLYDNLLDYTNKFNKHVAHPSLYGRHYTLDVDGYVGKYTNFNLQGIVSDLDTRIDLHVNDVSGAHDASAISVDDSKLQFNSNDVQEAIEELDQLNLNNVIYHRDNQHSNGILAQQDVTLTNDSHNVIVVERSGIAPFSIGSNHIRYSTIPVSLGQVLKGDKIKIELDSNSYEYNILQVDYTNGTVLFDGTIPIGGHDGFATIYAGTEEKTAPTVLKAVIRQKSVSETAGGSVIQLLHPNAPFIIGSLFNSVLLNSSPIYIMIEWDGGTTGDINLYYYLNYLFPTCSSWTAENVAYALNYAFRDVSSNNWFPIVAFDYNGRVGFAFNEPNGFIQIGTSSSPSANGALGLVAGEKKYAIENRRLYITGNEYFGIRKVIDAVGETDDAPQIINIDDNLYVSGVTERGLARISNHPSINGTFVFDSISSDSVSINELSVGFPSATGVGVKIYADTFSAAPDKRTLYELFVDGYAHPYVEFNGSPRIEYYNTPGYASHNPETWFDIVSISDTFLKSEKRIKYTNGSLQFGDRVAGGIITNAGNTVVLPTSNAEGFRFRLYDGTYVNYIDVEISGSGYTASGVSKESVDVDIYDKINTEQFLFVATVLHDRLEFRHLIDSRQFGTISEKDIGTDFKRDFISYPNSLLRSSGVVFGLSSLIDGGSTSFTLLGGQVFVNGTLFYVDTQAFYVPYDNVTSIYNLFIDEVGVCRFLKDDYFESGKLTTPSVKEIVTDNSKLMVAQVYVDSSNQITIINDFRKFVGKIDNKIDLFVEENDITNGSFASLFAAVNYLNAQASDYPGSKVLKIRGIVYHDISLGSVILPEGVKLSGDGNSNVKITSSTGTVTFPFCILNRNCCVENILFERDMDITVPLLFVDSLFGEIIGSADGLRVTGCNFKDFNSAFVFFFMEPCSNVIIEKCIFELSGMASPSSSYINVVFGSPYGLGFFDEEIDAIGVTNLIFKDNYIYSSGMITGIAIANGEHIVVDSNRFEVGGVFGTLVGFNNVYDSFINNNVFYSSGEITLGDFSLFTANGLLHLQQNANNLFISNNNIKIEALTNTSINNVMITLGENDSNLNNIFVTNNIISSGNVITHAIGSSAHSINNILIKDNFISLLNETNDAIQILHTTSAIFKNINIINNNIELGAPIGNGIGIYVRYTGSTGISYINITDNTIVNLYSSNDYILSCGIKIETFGDDESFNISNNTLKNTNSGCGFVRAIYLLGTPGNKNNINITSNLFYNFNTASSVALEFNSSLTTNIISNSFITDNVFIECSSAVKSNILLKNVKITDNIINNNTTGIVGALFDLADVSNVDICDCFVYSKMFHSYIVNISSGTVSGFNINNNNFEILYATNGIMFNSSSCLDCNINNNNINTSTNICIGIGASSGDIKYINILNNMFYGSYNSLVTMYTVSPNSVSSVDINRNMVFNNILSNTGGICINISSGVDGSNYNINDNVFVNTITTKGFLNAIVLSNATYINVNNNILKMFDAVTSHGILLTDVSFCNISSNISYGVANSISVSSTNNVFIKDNIVCNTTSGNSYLISVAGSTQNTYVENNTLWSSALSTSIIDCDNVMSNVYVSGNNIFCSGSGTPTYIIKYTNDSGSIMNINLCDNNINILNCSNSCIYVQGAANITNLNILGNNIIGSTLSGNGIYFNMGVVLYNATISNNNITSNASVPSLGDYSMIFVDGDVRLLNVSNNVLAITNSGKGTKNGIKINNASNVVISGNILDNFKYMSSTNNSLRSRAMVLNNIVGFIVANNNITSCALGLGLLGNLSDGIISNNIIECKSGYSAIVHDGTSTQTNISVVGNIFKNIITSMAGHLVYLSDGTAINICNNLFYFDSTTIGAFRLLVLYGNNSYIYNNMFVGTSNFTYAPVYISSDGTTTCAFNNFRGCTLASGTAMAQLVGGGTNYCNFGETYTANLSLAKFIIPSAFDGTSNWTTVTDDTGRGLCFAVNLMTTLNPELQALNLCFGSEVVPVGSEIKNVNVAYKFIYDGSTGIKVFWNKKMSVGAAETSVSGDEFFTYSSTAITKSISPDSTPVIMGSDNVHSIYIQNLGTCTDFQSFIAYGASVVYKL